MFHVIARMLQQSAVLNTARTSGFTRATTETSINVGAQVGVSYGVFMAAASVDVGYARKFSVSSEGMSSIAARLVSLPPPEIFIERLRREFQQDIT